MEATSRATLEIPMRCNVVEPFTFQNPGNNTGWGTPFIYYHYSSQPGPMRIRAELKGFGGEIKSTADWVFTSTENMADAVLAYVLNNVILSRGEGCIPGFLGIGVGGYLSEAMMNAKNAVFRELVRPRYKVLPMKKNDSYGNWKEEFLVASTDWDWVLWEVEEGQLPLAYILKDEARIRLRLQFVYPNSVGLLEARRHYWMSALSSILHPTWKEKMFLRLENFWLQCLLNPETMAMYVS